MIYNLLIFTSQGFKVTISYTEVSKPNNSFATA